MTVLANLTSSAFVGGPERQMLGLASALPEGLRSSFVLFGEGGPDQPFARASREAGHEVAVLLGRNSRPWGLVAELARRLDEIGADVLLCHGYKADLLGLAAARRRNIPAVAVSHGWTAATPKVRLYEAADRLALRRMDLVACVSEAQSRRVREAGVPEDRVEVVRNAIEPSAYAEVDPSAGDELRSLFPEPPPRIVGAAGRLSPEKGFEVLVEAAVIATEDRRDVGFVLFGDGPCRPSIERAIDRLGLRDRVVLAGFRTDLPRFLPHLDLVALPSFTEGLPVIALEALAAGVPVVATAVGGTPEAVRDGVDGRLVPPGRPYELSRAISDLIDRDALRRTMGRRGRARVASEFTFAAQAGRYARLVERLRDAGHLGRARAGTPRPAPTTGTIA